ncbi:DUF2147 domain-containing protein [Pararhodobacter marinus]|uniref:DUF2147 domain-containing protein n=1 Tax=Pararhodobacter marinus TaxID=2184063 RepID=A0A2U2C864_9RHOB|nr:DUF2147 domain-containing protein [Pararhodobacter marinus]PWE28053.1 DUF2147 domain-containing protein [Pararhodobacter marinus]|eukprot:m.260287 g.260287  ORF g.260287 m.260287 type:complete len:131 (+) comp39201_c0_seq1:1-393(+)
MKSAILAFAAGLALSATAALADPAEGRWRTQPDDNGNYGVIQMSMCGNTLCGTLVESYDGAGNALQTPNNGRQIVWDMEPHGNGEYRDGQIYAPDRDQTYRSRMDLAGDRLTVAGCVLFICRDQTWTRDN